MRRAVIPARERVAVIRRLIGADLAHVQVLRYDPGLGKLAVTADDRGAVADAVQYLIGQGHRSIAYVGTPLTLSTGVARLQGYRSALEARGIGFDEGLARFGPTLPAFGREAAQDMLKSNNRITAFMVASARQLLGVLQALKAANLRLPEDVSVIGYGDTEWFDLATPSISAVALPVEEMSNRATQILFTALSDKSAPAAARRRAAASVFKPKLTIRESTGPARKAKAR